MHTLLVVCEGVKHVRDETEDVSMFFHTFGLGFCTFSAKEYNPKAMGDGCKVLLIKEGIYIFLKNTFYIAK